METFLALPYPVTVACVFIFGLLIGSFSNVCIHRLPKEESVSFPGSHCTACNTPIRAFDNIPVFSYLLLGGKCRACGQKISIVYPLIEIVVALLIVAVYIRFGVSWEFLIYAVVTTALVIITLIDYEHQIIPDRITLPGIVLGLGAGAYLVGPMNSVLGFLLGGGLFYLLAIFEPGRHGRRRHQIHSGGGSLAGLAKNPAGHCPGSHARVDHWAYSHGRPKERPQKPDPFRTVSRHRHAHCHFFWGELDYHVSEHDDKLIAVF